MKFLQLRHPLQCPKRSREAAWIEKELKETVEESITEVSDYNMSKNDSVKQAHKKMLYKNKDVSLNKIIVCFDKELQNQK